MRRFIAHTLVMTALAASACQASGRLDIQVKDGRVGIDAQATTVQEILDALVARGLVRVTSDEASSFRARLTTVNKRFGRRDLATALDSILIEIPHELVRGANGAVTEVRLVNPMLRGRPATTAGAPADSAPRAIVEPVVPSRAAVRAGRHVAAGAVAATSLPPVTSRAFALEAEPEGTGPGGPPPGVSAGSTSVSGYGRNQSGGAPSNALAARIAERRAAIQQRAGAPAYPAQVSSPANLTTSTGQVATSATVAPVVVAAATSPTPKRVSNRPPIAAVNPLEVPANPYRISGLEMPSLASAEEKAGYHANRVVR